jgi:hypothetical protein
MAAVWILFVRVLRTRIARPTVYTIQRYDIARAGVALAEIARDVVRSPVDAEKRSMRTAPASSTITAI